MKDDGGPAFPHNLEMEDGSFDQLPGMSLRDWFAGMALQGMCAAPPSPNATLVICDETKWRHDILATAAYMASDAMLAERNKP
jgi:hypothetical protein